MLFQEKLSSSVVFFCCPSAEAGQAPITEIKNEITELGFPQRARTNKWTFAELGRFIDTTLQDQKQNYLLLSTYYLLLRFPAESADKKIELRRNSCGFISRNYLYTNH